MTGFRGCLWCVASAFHVMAMPEINMRGDGMVGFNRPIHYPRLGVARFLIELVKTQNPRRSGMAGVLAVDGSRLGVT
jgi:hypothetical protein